MSSRVYAKKKKSYQPRGTQSVGFTKRVMGATSTGNKNKGELKALDTAIDTFNAGAPSGWGVPFTNSFATANIGIMLLNDVGPGSGFYQRVGRKIDMKSVEFKLSIRPGDGSTVSYGGLAAGNYGPSYLRMMILYDSQANGALPAIADIFQNTNSLGANTNTVFSLINLNNRERFKVLRDVEMTTPGFSIVAGPPVVLTTNTQADQKNWETAYSDYIKLKGLPVQFKSDNAPIPAAPVPTNIATGALYLIMLSESSPATTGWVAEGTARLRYYDV